MDQVAATERKQSSDQKQAIDELAKMKLLESKLQDKIKEQDTTIEGEKKAVAFWTAKFNDLDKRFNAHNEACDSDRGNLVAFWTAQYNDLDKKFKEHKEASQKEREHLESRLQQTAQTEKEKLLKLIADAP